jgi:pimeloyl-ACP methyl ester carboxylesterase
MVLKAAKSRKFWTRPAQRLQVLRKATLAISLLLTFVATGWQQSRAADAAEEEVTRPAACKDNTPHEVTFVTVEPGVQLEVVGWGGSDKTETMVLLAGGGDNAHVYDQFAFQFTDYFHVIGITRRGYLPSSQPEHGYDVPARAADDIAVLDHFGIDKAVFVGHSAAGMELSELGLAYPDRVDKLVYLDAADLSERSKVRREPPFPVYTEEDRKSLWDFQAATARLQAVREPDPSVCHRVIFSASGALVDETTPEWVPAKIDEGVAALRPTDWARIEAPRLGIFALFTTRARQPWYWYLSPAKKAEFDEAWRPIVAWHRRTIAKFEKGNAANTFLLPGAPHYVYIYNEAEVVRWMRDFLGIPLDFGDTSLQDPDLN